MPGPDERDGEPAGRQGLRRPDLRSARRGPLDGEIHLHRERRGQRRRGRESLGRGQHPNFLHRPRRILCGGPDCRLGSGLRRGNQRLRGFRVPIRVSGLGAVRQTLQDCAAVAEAQAVRHGHERRLHQRQAAGGQAQDRGRKGGEALGRRRRPLRNGGTPLRRRNGRLRGRIRRQPGRELMTSRDLCLCLYLSLSPTEFTTSGPIMSTDRSPPAILFPRVRSRAEASVENSEGRGRAAADLVDVAELVVL